MFLPHQQHLARFGKTLSCQTVEINTAKHYSYLYRLELSTVKRGKIAIKSKFISQKK